ncbi:MAG: RHS repeat-associated core domain-containing protein [Gammaproteobacteria bacterium]
MNYLTGANIDETFSRTDSTGSYSYLTDNLGSTLALTTSAGAISTSYSYEPYGNTTQSGSTSSNSLQYTGRENDGDGLYYNRARYYSPSYGRFISEDPIGLLAGINEYAYVVNDPISMGDPLGLFCLTAGAKGAISGALGGAVTGFIDTGFDPLGALGGAVVGGGFGYISGSQSINGGFKGVLLGAVGGAASSFIGEGDIGAVVGGGVGGASGNPAAGAVGGFVGGVLDNRGGSFLKMATGGLKGGYAGLLGGFISFSTQYLLNAYVPTCSTSQCSQ